MKKDFRGISLDYENGLMDKTMKEYKIVLIRQYLSKADVEEGNAIMNEYARQGFVYVEGLIGDSTLTILMERDISKTQSPPPPPDTIAKGD